MTVCGARADITVTVTQTNTECKVPAPDAVTAPATPSTAGGEAAMKNRNYALAAANLKPLAEKVDAEAQRIYGNVLMTKCMGEAPAEVSLGYLYLTGRGTPKDLYQGMVWSVKAGEQGAPMALANIANAYCQRVQALPQDNDNAAYYMALAIERSTGAQRQRVQANINNIARAVSADEVRRASDRARRWSPGRGSLSDVLDDAARMQKRQAKN